MHYLVRVAQWVTPTTQIPADRKKQVKMNTTPSAMAGFFIEHKGQCSPKSRPLRTSVSWRRGDERRSQRLQVVRTKLRLFEGQAGRHRSGLGPPRAGRLRLQRLVDGRSDLCERESPRSKSAVALSNRCPRHRCPPLVECRLCSESSEATEHVVTRHHP